MIQKALSGLLRESKGHFEFESGHHGETWLELELLFHEPALVQPLAESLGKRIKGHAPEVVCGPLTEGAFLGLLISMVLESPFCYTTRQTLNNRVAYRLPSAFLRKVEGKRVAVLDDVVNAGSAVASTVEALQSAGANVIVIGALVVYGVAAGEIATANGVQLEALDERPGRLWEASDCPLCADGVPVDRRG